MTTFDRERFERDVTLLVRLTVSDLRRIAKREGFDLAGLTSKRQTAESIAYQRQKGGGEG